MTRVKTPTLYWIISLIPLVSSTIRTYVPHANPLHHCLCKALVTPGLSLRAEPIRMRAITPSATETVEATGVSHGQLRVGATDYPQLIRPDCEGARTRHRLPG